jgi:transcriptional regulator with XRE-family HTH domain
MANTFAERLKVFRESTRLSQLDFGKPCGLSQKMISLLEAGREPKASYIEKIESAYDKLRPTWLRKGTGDMLRESGDKSETSKVKPTLPGGGERVRPTMSGSPNVEEMTPEQLAVFYKLRSERAERKLHEALQRLALYEEAEDQHEAVQLVPQVGGRSFTNASADAADDDYTPPQMTAETNQEYAEKAAESDRLRIAGFVIGRR